MGTKISALTTITGANTATGDLLVITDVSDTTQGAGGTTKSITRDEMKTALFAAPGVIGGTTPAAGSFTTLSASGAITATTTGKVGTTLGVGGATPAASGAGITFPATQLASPDPNTMDDYEEGFATVTLDASTSGTITLNTTPFNRISYQKSGNKVTIIGALTVASISSPVGLLKLSGLPFACGTSSSLFGTGAATFNGMAATANIGAITTGGAGAVFAYIVTRQAAGSSSSNAADVAASGEVNVHFEYFVD